MEITVAGAKGLLSHHVTNYFCDNGHEASLLLRNNKLKATVKIMSNY